MRVFLFLNLLLIFSCTVHYGQTPQNTAPVKWQNYRLSNENLSIQFPKLPVLTGTSNYCAQSTTNIYAAYAEDSAYKLSVVKKLDEIDLSLCSNSQLFDEKAFNRTVAEAAELYKTTSETKMMKNGREVVLLTGDGIKMWFVNDLKNDRWFELAFFTNGKEKKSEKYFNSLKLTKNPKGIEIGNGSEVNLGDELKKKQKRPAKNENTKEEVRIPMRLITKPKPAYTDAARQNNVQGTITLRATFLSNGAIGSVSVVNGLPFGLNEQAISATRKITFLPQKINGENKNVARTLQYAFSIY